MVQRSQLEGDERSAESGGREPKGTQTVVKMDNPKNAHHRHSTERQGERYPEKAPERRVSRQARRV